MEREREPGRMPVPARRALGLRRGCLRGLPGCSAVGRAGAAEPPEPGRGRGGAGARGCSAQARARPAREPPPSAAEPTGASSRLRRGGRDEAPLGVARRPPHHGPGWGSSLCCWSGCDIARCGDNCASYCLASAGDAQRRRGGQWLGIPFVFRGAGTTSRPQSCRLGEDEAVGMAPRGARAWELRRNFPPEGSELVPHCSWWPFCLILEVWVGANVLFCGAQLLPRSE